MNRQFIEASDISSLLVGFKVLNIEDAISTCIEDKTTDDIVVITFVNNHHVAVDMVLGTDGNYISEPYSVNEDFENVDKKSGVVPDIEKGEEDE